MLSSLRYVPSSSYNLKAFGVLTEFLSKPVVLLRLFWMPSSPALIHAAGSQGSFNTCAVYLAGVLVTAGHCA